ncbi:hypothetical protein GC173_00475 [bacterium]|nr:hypothetical protein [bacterium]
MKPSNVPGWCHLVPVGVICIFAFRLLWHWISPTSAFVSQTPDDAYYYFQVSRNLAAGVGSTFDGTNSTNGYHPLWMLCCAFVAVFFHPSGNDLSDLEYQARTLLSLQWLLGVGGILLLLAAGRRMGLKARALCAMIAVAALPPVVYGCTDGLESGLVLLGLGGLAFVASREAILSARPWKREIEFGMILSMLFLARLDLALLCLGLGVLATLGHLRRLLDFPGWWRKALGWGLPVILVASIYFAINYATTGSLSPISGKLKSGFPNPVFFPRPHAPYVVMGACLLALTAFSARRESRPALRHLLIVGAVFQSIHLVYTALFMRWGVYTWHLTGYWPFAMLAIGSLADGAVEHEGFRARLVGVVCVLLVTVGLLGQVLFLWRRDARAFQAQSYAAALWTRESLPAKTHIGMSDCGVFGYYRGGGVVNLDGLINNIQMQEHIAHQGLASYLDAESIDFIAHHAIPAGDIDAAHPVYRYSRPSRLYLQKADSSITLHRVAIVYQGPAFIDGRGVKRFVIWRRGGLPRMPFDERRGVPSRFAD